jgi:cyclophilin family peptidyl-prolyl cis-trans isomerase
MNFSVKTGRSMRNGWQRIGRTVRGLSVVCVLAVLGSALPRPADAQTVRVTTDMGAFTMQLDPERAPLTVANFMRYVNEGFYSNTLFHRVVGGFVVQGGGHSAVDMKLKSTHEAVINESGNGLQNKRGTVGMARSASPHSANAQFYINLADNPELDPLPTRWGYAVFGRVIDGMDVLDKIGVVATGAVGPFKSEAPLKPIVIQKVEVISGGGPSSGGPSAVNPAVMPSSGAAPGGAAPGGNAAGGSAPGGGAPGGTAPSGTQPGGAPSGAVPGGASPPPAGAAPGGAYPPPSGAAPAGSAPSSDEDSQGAAPSGATPPAGSTPPPK